MIIENIIDSIFIVIIICWLLLLIQSHRMFYTFRKKYPEIVKKNISNAFSPYVDPEKILFFFKRKNISLLQNDKEIWRLRQQTKLLFFLSIGIPIIIAFLSIFFFRRGSSLL